MSKTILTSILSLAVFCFLGAQDLHIHYDAQTKSIKYIYDGEEIKRPKVKKNSQIYLHVDNYNNYLYDIDVKANTKSIRVAQNGFQSFSGFSSGGGLPFLPGGNGGSFLGDYNSGATDLYNDMGDLDFGGPGMVESESFEVAEQLKVQFEEVLRDMIQTERSVRGVKQVIEEYQEQQAVDGIILSEIEKVKKNPYLNPDQIKKLLNEYLSKSLGTEDVSQLNLEELITKADGQTLLEQKANDLEGHHLTYRNQIQSLKMIADQFGSLGISDGEVVSLQNDMLQTYENARLVEQTIQNNRLEISTLKASDRVQNLERLVNLRNEYEVLKNNQFSYSYHTEARGDQVDLGLKFVPRDSITNTAASTIEVPSFNVPVIGGLKVNASVGISFGQFFNRPKTYFIRDSTIFGDNRDSFLPIVTSYFHFYGQTTNMVTLGGSFGIGVPLSAEDGLQSASFFMGPSLIIGRGERIVINTGIMGGRVTRLAKGYSEGDTFISDADNVPVRHPYELGIFLGLSFNLMGN